MGPLVAVSSPTEVPVEPAPVNHGERIATLDALRGFALMGILLMNITAFAMHGAAYDNPTVAGGANGPNLAVWAILHVLAEGKMRCLFSLVFGASMLLLTDRLEASGRAADVYYRRTMWLLLFGFLHAYLLWLGDVLYPYALCGLILFPLRKLSAKALLITGVVVLALTAVAYLGLSLDTKEKIEKGRVAMRLAADGAKLTPEQAEEKTEYESWRKFNQPSEEEIQADIRQWRGNPIEVIKARAKVVSHYHSLPYYSPMNWDVWSMMLIGMGLYRLGIVSGQRPVRTYVLLLLAGYGIGVPVNTVSAWLIIRSNFDPVQQLALASTYDIGRITVALGHLAAIVLMCRSRAWSWLTSRLAAAGQMAFSNYILQSVICTFLFTGYGFGWYGSLQRYQLYYVVVLIWMFELAVSPIWLRHYRFGPLEWCWRSLTYGHAQPFRRYSSAIQDLQ